MPGKSIHLMAEKQTRDVVSIAGKLRDFDLICIKKLKCCFIIILQFDLILENVGKLQFDVEVGFEVGSRFIRK